MKKYNENLYPSIAHKIFRRFLWGLEIAHKNLKELLHDNPFTTAEQIYEYMLKRCQRRWAMIWMIMLHVKIIIFQLWRSITIMENVP